jgi:hypothetical protein
LLHTRHESKKKVESFYILGYLLEGTYDENLANLDKIFHEKSCVWVKIVFFKSKFRKKLPVKEILHYDISLTEWHASPGRLLEIATFLDPQQVLFI